MWNKNICGNCHFYKATGMMLEPDSSLGECRRHAPHPVLTPLADFIAEESLEYVAAWPLVSPQAWCGEFIESQEHVSR